MANCWFTLSRRVPLHLHSSETIRRFLSHGGTPIAGWLMMETPITMDEKWGYPPFYETSILDPVLVQSQSAEFCRGFLRCRGDIGFGISRPGCQASRWVDGHSMGLVLSPKQHAICTQLITALNSLCMGVVPFVPRRQIQKHRGSNMQQRKLQGFLK